MTVTKQRLNEMLKNEYFAGRKKSKLKSLDYFDGYTDAIISIKKKIKCMRT